MADPNPVLVYGIGNPGRTDDGLGIKFAEAVAAMHLPGVDVETAYQLNAEDALEISTRQIVMFVDAAERCPAPLQFSRLTPAPEVAFSTHIMQPASVLALCSELYHRLPQAYVLAIAGSSWEMREALSPGGEEHLAAALSFAAPLLRNPDPMALDRATEQ